MALLTLADAKKQLDIESTAHDTELQLYIDALTAVIEGYVGAVEERTVTETVEGNGLVLRFRTTPVVSVTSLTPILSGEAAVEVSGLAVDGSSGVVRLASGARLPSGPWIAVYIAGRGEVPATIKLAALILLQHLWRTQNGAARGAGPVDDFSVTEPIPGFGYAVPNRVLQLLEPYKVPPGVA